MEKEHEEFSDRMKGLTTNMCTMSNNLQMPVNSIMIPNQNHSIERVPQDNAYPYLANICIRRYNPDISNNDYHKTKVPWLS